MKKILFSVLAAVCTLIACDPVHEDISNDGHINVDELKSMTTVTLDKDANGVNGNVLTCNTSAPVKARWSVDGKEINIGAYAWKKLKLGKHTVRMEGLCADGTLLTEEYEVNCDVITDPLERFYIFGDPKLNQAPVVLNQGDAGAGRFSDNEGKGLPFIKDNVYWGFKSLVFDIETAPSDGGIWGEPAGPAMIRVMNGWWAATYQDEVIVETGLWELPLTEAIAKDCAQGNGGSGKDLDILVRRGTVTIKAVYYEE